MTEACGVSFEVLVDYRFGELSSAEELRLEEHLFTCERCAERALWIAAVGRGVADLFRRGAISSAASARAVEHAAGLGLSLRSYAIEPGQSVACTAGPDDDLIVVRLRVDAPDVESVDVETEITFIDAGRREARVLADVPLDRGTREVVYLFAGDYVRRLPRSAWVMQARVRAGGGERRIGPFTMQHTPWHELPS